MSLRLFYIVRILAILMIVGNSLQENIKSREEENITPHNMFENLGKPKEVTTAATPGNETEAEPEITTQEITTEAPETPLEELEEGKYGPNDYTTGYRAGVVQYFPYFSSDNYNDRILTVERNLKNYEIFIKEAANLKSHQPVDMIIFPEYGLMNHPKHLTSYYTFIPRVTERMVKVEKERNVEGLDLPRKYGENNPNFHLDKNLRVLRMHFEQIAMEIPFKKGGFTACENADVNSKVLQRLSCAAKTHKIYVVVNVYEREPCHYCHNYLNNIYNTNIVIDRNGTIIARYRKFNTFDEPWITKVEYPEISKFTTDFNVTFAQIIGSDIIEPIVERQIRNHPDVTDLIVSTHSFFDIPLLSSVSDYIKWSRKVNVNILVSGFSHDGGPGVYLANNKYIKGSPPKKRPHNVIWTANVTRVHLNNPNNTLYKEVGTLVNQNLTELDNKKNILHFIPDFQILKDDENFDKYFHVESVLLDDDGETSILTHIYPDKIFRCTFQVNMQPANNTPVLEETNEDDYDDEVIVESVKTKTLDPYYKYRLIALKGIFEFAGSAIIRVQACIMMACPNTNLNDCGKKPKNNETYRHRTINYMLVSSQYNVDEFVSPIGFTHNRTLIPDIEYTYVTKKDSKAIYTFKASDNFDLFGLIIRSKKLGPATHKSFLLEILGVLSMLITILWISSCIYICVQSRRSKPFTGRVVYNAEAERIIDMSVVRRATIDDATGGELRRIAQGIRPQRRNTHPPTKRSLLRRETDSASSPTSSANKKSDDNARLFLIPESPSKSEKSDEKKSDS